jgi:DNA-binding response OmpR family regulator
MPDEDGYTLLNRIRHFMHGAPVRAVALTALGRVEDRARALAAGFSMFVPKPFDPQELVAAIAALDEK